MNSKFQARSKLFVALLVLILSFDNFCTHFEALRHKIKKFSNLGSVNVVQLFLHAINVHSSEAAHPRIWMC